jgi:hypothetical protein
VSLITCCSAEDDAVGTRLTLCGPRGVIRITQEVIDKAGLNWLLVPHQSPFSFLNQSSLLLILPCLATPTPSHLILSTMGLGNVPPPRSPSTANVLSRKGVLGPPHTPPLSTSTGGWHGPSWSPICSMTCTWQTLLSQTKGGGELGEMFDISLTLLVGFLNIV